MSGQHSMRNCLLASRGTNPSSAPPSRFIWLRALGASTTPRPCVDLAAGTANKGAAVYAPGSCSQLEHVSAHQTPDVSAPASLASGQALLFLARSLATCLLFGVTAGFAKVQCSALPSCIFLAQSCQGLVKEQRCAWLSHCLVKTRP